jgi:anti-sigma factor (TIGR02949 family)
MDAGKKTHNRIDCEEAIRRIFDYIDHELTGQRLEEFQRHIETCHDCYDHTEFERLLKERIKNLMRGNTDALKKRVEELIQSF